MEGSAIIHFADLTVYPDASGETSFSISWPETTATPISVSVKITDVTQEVVTSLSNYTLRFNFTYEETQETVPDNAELRILGSWDNEGSEWSSYHVLTAESDGSYTYTIDKIDVLTDDDAWYTYVLVLGYPDEEYVNWSYELTYVEDTSLSFGVAGEEGDNYTNNIVLKLSAPMSSIISDLISEYTLTLTITYDGNNETLPTWADLYIAGSWINTGDVWETFEQLTPNEDRTEFTVTIHDVHPGWYNYDLVMSATGASPSWTNQITSSGDGYFEITSNTTSGSTSYTSSSALETIFPNPDTVTSATNYTVSFTITYNSTTNYKLNDYVALYLQGDWDNWGTPVEMTTSDHITYSYTFETITEVSHQCTIYYNYSGVTNFDGDDWAMKVENIYFTPNTTSLPVAVSTEVDINTALTDPNQGGDTGDEGQGGDTGDTGGTVSGTSITLYITFQLDGGTEQVLSDANASLYVIGAWDGDDTNGRQESDAAQLVYTDGKYVAEVSYDNETNVMENHYYNYDVYLVSGTTFSWNDSPILKLNGDEHLWWSYESGSLSKEETITLSDTFENLLAGLVDTNTYVENYTVVFTIKDSNGHVKKCPDGGSLYLGSGLNGSWNPSGWWEWGETYAQLTETVDNEGNVAYSYTAQKTAIGVKYEYNIEYAASGSEASWGTRLGDSNFEFTTDSVELNGYAGHTQYVTCTATTDVVNSLEDANDYSGETTYEGNVSLYFLVVDTSNATSTESITNCFNFNQSDVREAYQGIFSGNGNVDGWYNYSNATLTVGTVNSATHVGAYNSTVGNASTGDSISIEIRNWANGDNAWQTYAFSVTVPTNRGNTVTCVVYADLSVFKSALTDSSDRIYTTLSDVTYYSGTPTEIFAAGLTH
ncbi:MAG: hypothetical protein LUD22_02470 [Coprobacillus sp.]|nr:hypothetical protein [Coprobacillus sp.]